MIVRIWRGQATCDTAEAYLQHLGTNVIPQLQSIRGFAGMRVLRRNLDDRVEFLVTTQWRSLAAIRVFAGDDPEAAVVEPAARALLVEFDLFVRHFEIALESS